MNNYASRRVEFLASYPNIAYLIIDNYASRCV